MPKPTVIADERVRSVVIALVMAVLFAASLAAAAAISASSATVALELANLSLRVPQRWKQQQPQPPVPGFDPQILLQDPADPGRGLFVGHTSLRVAQNAQVMLAVALNTLARPAGSDVRREQVIDSFRLHNLTGARATVIDRSAGQLQHHELAVLTGNGLSHWVIHAVTTHPDADQAHAMIARDRVIFDTILRSARPVASDQEDSSQ